MAIRKRFSILALVCVAGALVAALCCCGCSAGKSDEELVTECVEDALKTFEKPTLSSLSQYFNVVDTSLVSDVGSYGVKPDDVLAHCLRGYGYSVDSVTVTGAAAQATVSITNVDLAAAASNTVAWLRGADNTQLMSALLQGDRSSATLDPLVEHFYAELDAQESDGLATRKLTLSLSKDDGSWTLNDSALRSILDAVTGGLDLSFLKTNETSFESE